MALYTQQTKSRLIINKKVLKAEGEPVELTPAEVKTLESIGVKLVEVVEEEDAETEVVEVVEEVELPGYQDQLAALSKIDKVPTARSKPSVEAAYVEHILGGEVE
jgi:hypothetical protein